MTATSSGTRRPASCSARMAPRARVSLQAEDGVELDTPVEQLPHARAPFERCQSVV